MHEMSKRPITEEHLDYTSQRPRKRSTGPLAIVGLVSIFVLVGVGVYSALTSKPPPPSGPTLAPDFSLLEVAASGFTGKTISLSAYKGKVVVLEFMVSWCEHCMNMAPIVGSLHAQYAPKGVVFLTVAATWQGANAQTTAAFIKQFDATWTHVLDSSNTVFSQYGVSGTPVYVIIDSKGFVYARYEGETPFSTLSETLNLLVR